VTSAKRDAVNEIFGELITASTTVEDFVVTSDQIRASSIGYVRIQGDPDFYNGSNLAEVCITIHAYTTNEDRRMFVPEQITKRHCVTDDNLTTNALKEFAKEEVVVQALTDYEPNLKKREREKLLRLLQRIQYSESGFIPETETYCVTVSGDIVPIEVVAFIEEQYNEPENGMNFSHSEKPENKNFISSFSQMQQASASNSYTKISNRDNIISIEVPKSWSEVSDRKWIWKEKPVGIQLVATTDLDSFINNWDTLGVFFGVSSTLVKSSTPQIVLDGVDYSDDCTYKGRKEISNSDYTGFFDVWSDCDGGETLAVITSVVPETQEYIVLAEIFISGETEMSIVDHIMNNFVVTLQ
jgi:hypothetical protein